LDFSADPGKPAGDRTISLGEAREMTMSWDPRRSSPKHAPLYIACGTACALFTCMMGYWIGRASAPVPDGQQGPSYSTQVQPMDLPTPPTGLSVPTPVAGAGLPAPRINAAPAVYDPAVVTIRPKAGEPVTPARSAALPTSTPHPSVYQNPVVFPRQSPKVTVQTALPAAAAPAPATPQAAPSPSDTVAVVMVRNTAAVPVELSIDGPEQLTAVVAPGSALPVTLPPGTYQLHASRDGLRSRRSTLALAANRSYSLIVDRRQDSGRDSLVLIEPAIDGQGG
jgi:hypothetical protein